MVTLFPIPDGLDPDECIQALRDAGIDVVREDEGFGPAFRVESDHSDAEVMTALEEVGR